MDVWVKYIKIALRHAARARSYLFINVFGLALGVACCCLIIAFVQHQRSFDSQYEPDRVFRVNQQATLPGGAIELSARTPAPLANLLREQTSGVETVLRVAPRSQLEITPEASPYHVRTLFVDSTYFDLFPLPRVAGRPARALTQPDAVVLTEAAADRLFGGGSEALGRLVTVGFESDLQDLTVSGVVENPPANSSFQFEALIPFQRFPDTLPAAARSAMMTGWETATQHTFLRVRPSAEAGVRESLERIARDRYGSDATQSFTLQTLKEAHFAPEIAEAMIPTFSKNYLFALVGLAVLILGIASINFATISMGQSVDRDLEVGVHKSIGAHRSQIWTRFWSESTLTSMLSTLLGIGFAGALLPFFNRIVVSDVRLTYLMQPGPLLILGGVAVVTGIAAGGYPALVLGRLHPSTIFKGDAAIGGGQGLTRVLIVFQYTVSTAFVIGAIVMGLQLSHLEERDLGFNEEGLISIGLSNGQTGRRVFERFKQRALTNGDVRSVSGSAFSYGNHDGMPIRMRHVVDGSSSKDVMVQSNLVTPQFIETMQIPIVQGRPLQEPENPGNVLVNESMVQAMGWEHPIGRELPLADKEPLAALLKGKRIVGVVADYHLRSPQYEIEPVVLIPTTAMGGGIGTILVRVDEDNEREALSALRSTWKGVAPDVPFDYSFVQQRVRNDFQSQNRRRAAMTFSSVIALLIAGLGLFGLASLAVARRRKEIGIRKVMGASGASLASLISRDFLGLVLLSFVLAVPVAYYGADRWLANFAYRIHPGMDIFGAAAMLIFGTAAVAVGYQVYRAVQTDPVQTIQR